MRLSALALLVAIPWVCAAQSPLTPVQDAALHNDMKGALESARQLVKDRPEDAGAWQVMGILQLANGDAVGAESSFDRAVAKGAADKPSPTGLEDLARPGTRLYEGLRLQKTAIALQAGAAAAHNNRGAARLLLGRTSQAVEDFDQASILAPEWGVPWINGALAAIDMEDYPLADKNARQAMALGEKNVRVFTAIAEAQLLLGRTDRAEDALKQAFEYDHAYPYALLVKARLDLSQGRTRDAERAMTQALAAGPAVAVDSRLEPRATLGSIFGGTAEEFHLQHLERAFRGNAGAFRLLLNVARQLVEGRRNADQLAGLGGLTLASSAGVLHLDHYQINGGKPGAIKPIVGIGSNPEGDFRLNQSHALLLKSIPTGGASQLWLHLNHRTASVYLNTDTTSNYTKSIGDKQWLGEARWDLVHGPETLTQIGVAYASLNRTGTGGRPLEPSEQSLPAGSSKVWTAYIIHRHPLNPRMNLNLGAMAGGAAGNQQFQPLLDLAIRGSDSRSVHLRATPRFNDSISNLIPLDTVADTPQRNIIDRKDLSANLLNREPVVQGTRSRQQDFELTLNEAPTPQRSVETVIFNRRLNDINSQGGDARVATTLQLTPITEGMASGIEERVTLQLSSDWSMRVLLRYQETEADFENPTLLQGAYPTPVPASSRGMPNFPKYQAVASVDYARGRWVGRVVALYAGERPTAISTTLSGSPVTYLGTAEPAFTGHFFLTYKVSPSSNVVLRVFNLGSAGFYEGYPGRITTVLGYDYRF